MLRRGVQPCLRCMQDSKPADGLVVKCVRNGMPDFESVEDIAPTRQTVCINLIARGFLGERGPLGCCGIVGALEFTKADVRVFGFILLFTMLWYIDTKSKVELSCGVFSARGNGRFVIRSDGHIIPSCLSCVLRLGQRDAVVRMAGMGT